MSPSCISFASALLLLSSSSSYSFCRHSASSSSSSSSLRINPDTTIATRALASSTAHPNSMSAFRRSSSSPSFKATTVATTVGQRQSHRQTQDQVLQVGVGGPEGSLGQRLMNICIDSKYCAAAQTIRKVSPCNDIC